jgi:glycine/D-amino acid oxidase-like deaminating enzyme
MAAVDVAVIGGGIAGAATAAFLAEGGLRVRLYERSSIAAGASGRNSGIVQHPFDAVLAELYRQTVREYRLLADDPASSFAFPGQPVGLLLVGHDAQPAEQAAAAWRIAWPAAAPAILVADDLVRLEPALARDLVACRLDIGFPIAPASATEAFAALARRRGVDLVLGRDARPAIVAGRVVGVDAGTGIEPAGAVVVAAGPWAPAIVDPTHAWWPIRPSWGVVASLAIAGAPRHGLEAIDITIEPSDGDLPDGHAAAVDRPAVDAAVEFSLVPAVGTSALGSTFLPDEPDPRAWLDALRRVGSRYVPSVADAALVGLRSCARPVSRDGRPLVGAAPWVADLWIVAGHGPWGISTGPGSARLVADAILGRGAQDAIPAALAVGRFGDPAAPAG